MQTSEIHATMSPLMDKGTNAPPSETGRWKRFAALASALALLFGIAAAGPAHAQCINDAQGNDDEPGQKDLSQFCSFGTCNVSDDSIGFSWDNNSWPGGNTGDACALFDTNSNGFVDRAVCVTIGGAGVQQAGSPGCYTCVDTRPDRCAGSTLGVCTSTCSVGSTADPFAAAPTHIGNVCTATNANCRTLDTLATCCVTAGDTAGGALIDVCSYPSQSPGSDPSDCVVTRQCGNDPNDPVCDDGNPCTVDACATQVGTCTHVAGNQGTQCRSAAGICDAAEVCDGSSAFCPADQLAQSGICRNANGLCDVPESCNGASADCPADQFAQGGVCRASSGQCDVAETCSGNSNDCPPDGFQPDNTTCSDGNACTTPDVCLGGQCQPGALTVCNDGNGCTDEVCNPANGQCVSTNNTAGCSDGNACTNPDVCSGGACQAGAPTVCNDNNGCTNDTCNTGTGQCVYTNNTAGCSDGNACTNPDVCSGGACQAGAPTVCNDGNGCTNDACDTGSGACVYTPNSAPCSDGNACTNPDVCSGGACQAGALTVCNDGNVCTNDGCNTGTGLCEATPNSDPCDDEDACTTDDVCAGGQCDGGPTNCNDNNNCTTDSCSSPSGCVHDPVAGCCNFDSQCGDSDLCTENERCVNNLCVSDPVVCDDTNGCTTDSCDPDTGCGFTDNNDPCNDGDLCTTPDVCGGGQCQGTPVVCNDGNGCTNDACNPGTGLCVFTNNTASCSDGNACTNPDVCGGGACQAGALTVCNDGNGCTDDFCNPNTGVCGTTDNTDACSDGNACTNPDVCSGGACQAGALTVCNDGNGCTDDSCDTGSGQCVYDPNTDACSDGNACTNPDICSGGACQAGAPTVCNDNEECTDDSCDTGSGQCVYDANTAPCSDGNGCTVDDVCSAGRCASGDDKPCNDNELCTDDSCLAPSGDCQYLNNAEQCDDGNVCTVDDRCGNGSCQPGGDRDCNDHLNCTIDSCSLMNACEHTPVLEPCCDANEECADSDGCTENERCEGTACVSDPVDCADQDECTIDTCNNDGGGGLCVNTDCIDLPNPLVDCPSLECIPDLCGNGIVDGTVETCEPPDDDPNTPCRSDCTYCGDGVTQDGTLGTANHNEECDDGNDVTGCREDQKQKPKDGCNTNCTDPICKDPAKILLASYIDRFDFHGLLTASSVVNFANTRFVLELTDPSSNQVIYRASLRSGLVELWGSLDAGRFKYTNKTAKQSGGIASLKIKRMKDGSYKTTAKAYGNLYSSQDQMVTHVHGGGKEWTVVGSWQKSLHGWRFIE